MAIGDAVTSGTSGSILYVDASGDLAQDNANFFFDATNKYLRLNSGTGAVVIGDITGNARGNNALDIQTDRSSVLQVASGAQSTALGYRNRASASFAAAIGATNVASGYAASAFGTSNLASAAYATALGYYNQATGYFATAVGSENYIYEAEFASAFGWQNRIDGSSNGYIEWATALGNSNDVRASYGVAVGNMNVASQEEASAFGNSNTASGYASVAVGVGNTANTTWTSTFGVINTASGTYATAIGYFNQATHSRSTAVGFRTRANAIGASVFGGGGDTASSNLINNVANSTMIGPKTGATIHILSTGEVKLPYLTAESTTGTSTFAGYVGIGTTDPQRPLHVYRSTDGAPVRFEDSDGYCEINPTSASWTCTSDERLKENITTIAQEPILEKMQQLRAVEFTWKSDKAETTRIGFIAQEVEDIFPDFVQTDKETGLKSVAYGGFVPYIISAIQELAEKIEVLTVAVQELMAQGYSSTFGRFQKLTVGSPEQPTGITLYDEVTGDPYCLSVRNGNMVTRFGDCDGAFESSSRVRTDYTLSGGGGDSDSGSATGGESTSSGDTGSIVGTGTTSSNGASASPGSEIDPDLVLDLSNGNDGNGNNSPGSGSSEEVEQPEPNSEPVQESESVVETVTASTSDSQSGSGTATSTSSETSSGTIDTNSGSSGDSLLQ